MQDMFSEMKKVVKWPAILRSVLAFFCALFFWMIDFVHWFVSVFSVFSFALSAVLLIRVLAGSVTNGINKYLSKQTNPDAARKRLEETWKNGLRFKTGRIDTAYIISISRFLSSKVVPLQDVVWVYVQTMNGGFVPVSGSVLAPARNIKFLCVWYADGSCVTLSPESKGGIYTIWDYIRVNCPDVALGDTKEARRLYNAKEIHNLREYAHTQRL